MLLFPKAFVIASTIEEFSKTISNHIDKAYNFISDTWHPKLVTEIRECFAPVKKGWFNINEKNWGTYRISKMKLLIERIRFMLQVRDINLKL